MNVEDWRSVVGLYQDSFIDAEWIGHSTYVTKSMIISAASV